MDLTTPISQIWPEESAPSQDAVGRSETDCLENCAEAFSPPFTVIEPTVQSSPIVFSSPHSGRNYPPAFLNASKLGPKSIRRSEDAFVDEIISDMPGLGAPVLCAEFPRAFCDVNREAFELDPTMFVEDLPEFANSTSLRVACGLGTIARIVADGEEIYQGKLTLADAKARVTHLYRPYHATLKTLLDATKERFGIAILIDCHSMPSKIGSSRDRSHTHAADIILGDRFGASCAPQVIRRIEATLQDQGLRVVRNDPFAGGFCTEYYGLPHTGIHAVQIEINRRLYMDEATMKRNDGFRTLRSQLVSIIDALSSLNTHELSAI